ncbi:putative D-aminoacylase [Xylaria cf. heliscus]|nr:putative D-aminoacylase [Xylaria cf. heliscus]
MPHMKEQLLERLDRLGPTIQSICSVTGAPSVSLGVAYKGESIYQWSHGLVDTTKNLQPDSDTVYGIGSISKVFTASAIGILVDEGYLNWSTPVHTILPEFRNRNQFITEELTVEDLLCHHSGMANSNEWWYGADGELLFTKDQTMEFINALKPVSPLRSRYNYNNWNFALLGEVIERLTGVSYGTFISMRILDPMGMSRTSASHKFGDDENLALPYAVLDDLSAYQLPMPKSEDDTILGSVLGIQSTVSDLLTYSQGLIMAYHDQLESGKTASPTSPLKNVVKQLSAHTRRGSPSMFQKAYCLGMYRHQLPNPFDGLGCNTMFVNQMPVLVPGKDASLVLSHAGSLAGYTTFISLLPEIDCSIAVLVNSIGLGDPASWINQLLIESVIDSPVSNDYVALAKEAANNHASSVSALSKELQKARLDIPLSRPFEDYIGRYQDPNRSFFVDVNFKAGRESQLQISFQGRESQTWALDHYHGDTFLCFNTSFNDLAKRAIFTFLDEDYFQFTFCNDGTGEMTRLYWAHDGNIPAEEQFFLKVTGSVRNSFQRPILKNLSAKEWGLSHISHSIKRLKEVPRRISNVRQTHE